MIKKAVPILALLIVIASAVILYIFYHNEENYTRTFFSMDTTITLKLSDDLIDSSVSEVNRLDRIFDAQSKEGEAFCLNNERSLECSADMAGLINALAPLNERFSTSVDVSCGALTSLWKTKDENPSVPDAADIEKALETIGMSNVSTDGSRITLKNGACLDFGSVAKGYALDSLRNIYEESKLEWGIAAMGSSTLLYGKKPDGKAFEVQIRNPDGDGVIGSVKTDACFISSSGGYERFFEVDGVKYHHIIDLSTGYPSKTTLTSVTVFTDNGLKSDFLSTLIFLEGESNLSKHLNAEDYSVVAVNAKGEILCSEGLDFTPLKDTVTDNG